MAPFQNGVRQSRHPTNMATVAKTEKVDEFFFLLNYWANWIQALLK
jgi:hypothetical protein